MVRPDLSDRFRVHNHGRERPHHTSAAVRNRLEAVSDRCVAIDSNIISSVQFPLPQS